MWACGLLCLPAPEMRHDTLPWWRQAEADLVTADLTLDGGRWYAASWFAQQAAEQALKALYIEKSRKLVPDGHDLERLGRLVGATTLIEDDLAHLPRRRDDARYPDASGVAPVDAVGQADATRHVARARRILQWVQPQL